MLAKQNGRGTNPGQPGWAGKHLQSALKIHKWKEATDILSLDAAKLLLRASGHSWCLILFKNRKLTLKNVASLVYIARSCLKQRNKQKTPRLLNISVKQKSAQNRAHGTKVSFWHISWRRLTRRWRPGERKVRLMGATVNRSLPNAGQTKCQFLSSPIDLFNLWEIRYGCRL